MVLYLDIILLLNFLLDYLILLATAKSLGLSYKKWRLIVASVIGAFYIIVFFIPALSILTTLFFKIAFSVLMIIISFNFINLMNFFRLLAVFYFISFVIGGGVLAIQYMFNIKHEVVNGILVSKSTNPFIVVGIIILASILIWLFSKNTLISLKRKKNIEQQIVDIQIFINDFSYSCKGLIDTGNRLYDPMTRKPVMILEADGVSFFPIVLKSAYINGKFQIDSFNKIADDIEPIWCSKIQLVPFRSVSSKMQFILTLRADKVVIRLNAENELCQTKVLIGLDYGYLSSDKSYQALVHPELLVV